MLPTGPARAPGHRGGRGGARRQRRRASPRQSAGTSAGGAGRVGWTAPRASTSSRRCGRRPPGSRCGGGAGPDRFLLITRDDIRVRRFEEHSDRLLILSVDASGSAAAARLAEAKGACELLLAEAYVRRDHVALIAFRGTAAELLLPPTRSLVQAKRRLAALPGGGSTPLAAGLRAALDVAESAARARADADARRPDRRPRQRRRWTAPPTGAAPTPMPCGWRGRCGRGVSRRWSIDMSQRPQRRLRSWRAPCAPSIRRCREPMQSGFRPPSRRR